MILAWQRECSDNYQQVVYWYETAKDCNWGLPAKPNGLFVIDLDVHDEDKNGVDNFWKLLNNLDVVQDITKLCCQMTPSGGLHIIYQMDDDLSNVANNSNVFKDYPGIDFRTDGYIVVEPSSINGKDYRFLTDVSPTIMPSKLKEFILNNSEQKTKEHGPYIKPKEVLTGDRDNQLFKYLNHIYYKTDLDFDEVVVLANYFNENILEEPFDERDVLYKVRKAFEKPRGTRIIIRLGEDNDETKND